MPENQAPLLFFDYFADLPDPRRAQGQRHKLVDILFIALCAVLCGADDFTAMEEVGRAKESWLRQYLELPHGIPSHDTFGRVFASLAPTAFEQCFSRWVQRIVALSAGAVVALDGKRVRRSYDKADECAAIELVSAWARENRLTLGQVKVAADSNEITAMPELLQVLAIKGCIVTVDALNCQKEIAAQVRDQQADYVLALKGNHHTLHEQVESFFQAVRGQRTSGFTLATHRTIDKEHGRIEERRYWQVNAPDYLYGFAQWADLQSIGMVEAIRDVQGHSTTERRYYLSSMPVEVEQFSKAVRGHWAIENSCHWVLDVVFGEDDSRVRVGHAAENFALVRRMANNLLQQERTLTRGVKTKRLKAALDERYLLKVLQT